MENKGARRYQKLESPPNRTNLLSEADSPQAKLLGVPRRKSMARVRTNLPILADPSIIISLSPLGRPGNQRI
jgi:hypothetical protein